MRRLNVRRLPWPTDWAALFGAGRPLVLEIGFGQGHFLLHLARERPDANLVGLEISNRCLSRVERAVERQGLRQVRLIHSMAETALQFLFTTASIDEVHVNFPDPWFRKRHRHRRLMQRQTLDLLVNRLRPGAGLTLATDIRAYAEMSHALLDATPGLDNQLDAPWVGSLPGRVVTRYERVAREEGRRCYFMVWRRNGRPPPAAPRAKELPMPHVLLRSPMSLAAMRARFEPLQWHSGATHVSCSRVFHGERSLLFDVYVKEPNIDQHLALLLLERRNRPGEFTLQPAMYGHPRATEGLHLAINALADWLLALDEGAALLGRKTGAADPDG
ncbi:MAG: tRNA (guanosine(46)-N7)-methyltransferase TrmB [Anaerolineaceae bacterium]|nr:tRNA (guanosine(46)-N7)-methyltransferase TrmB [Anaerolineaceae bacterium]